MEEDGIILGGEGVTTDDLLFRSEMIEEFSKMFHANRFNVSAKRRGTLLHQIAQPHQALDLAFQLQQRPQVACILRVSSRLPRDIILSALTVGIRIYAIPRSCDASSGTVFSKHIKR